MSHHMLALIAAYFVCLLITALIGLLGAGMWWLVDKIELALWRHHHEHEQCAIDHYAVMLAYVREQARYSRGRRR